MEIYTAVWNNKENNDGKMIMEYGINWKENVLKLSCCQM